MTREGLIISPLKKAIASLEKALDQPKNEFTRDAAIQRFEYTYELSWKLLKRHLELALNIEEYNIKDIFRAAGRTNILDDVEKWFLYHKARNLTSHTYNEKTAEETFSIVKKFLPDAKKLLEKFENIYGLSAD